MSYILCMYALPNHDMMLCVMSKLTIVYISLYNKILMPKNNICPARLKLYISYLYKDLARNRIFNYKKIFALQEVIFSCKKIIVLQENNCLARIGICLARKIFPCKNCESKILQISRSCKFLVMLQLSCKYLQVSCMFFQDGFTWVASSFSYQYSSLLFVTQSHPQRLPLTQM